MKTKFVVTAFLLSISLTAFAQEKISLEKRITNYSIKIDSIVSAEQKKMNVELDALEKKFQYKEITDVQLKNERDRISTAFSETINSKINAERDDFDEITKESAMNPILGKEDDRITHLANKRKQKNPKELLKSFDLVYAISFLNSTNDSELLNFSNNSDGISFGKSRSSNLGIRWERQLGKNTSPVFYSFGLGLRSDSYNLRGDQVFTQQNDQLLISPFFNGNLKYSRLMVDYLEIPLNFNFVLNPKYIDYDGEKYLDANKRQLRVGVGVYGGVKVGNRIRYKYSNAESSKNIFIQRVHNGLNSFEFGGKVSIGYAGINLFLKKDFTPAFNADASVANKYPMQVGIEFVSLNF